MFYSNLNYFYLFDIIYRLCVFFVLINNFYAKRDHIKKNIGLILPYHIILIILLTSKIHAVFELNIYNKKWHHFRLNKNHKLKM